MSSRAARFAAHLTALLSGALIVVSALAFRPAVAAWMTLGLAILGLLAALGAFAMPDQGAARASEVLLVLGGSWAIVAARVFSDPEVVKWLCFASGVMFAVLGVLGLLVHEVSLEAQLRRRPENGLRRHELTRRRHAPPVPDHPEAFR